MAKLCNQERACAYNNYALVSQNHETNVCAYATEKLGEGLVTANCTFNMMSTQVLTYLVVLCCLSAVWAMPGHLVLMSDGISKVKNHSIATFNKTL